MLNCSIFLSNGPLAQSVERGSNNGKVLCSRLKQITFHFLFGLLSLFELLPYIQSVQCLKNAKLFYICIEWSVSSVGRTWC